MTSPAARARAAKRRLAQSAPTLPDDIKADIAAAVRSIEVVQKGSQAGVCLSRSLVGYVALEILRISTRIELGGVIFRAGPDAVMSFCGSDYLGEVANGVFSAHYFLTTDAGEIVDFAVGDWKDDSPDQWTIDPPQFHWDAAEKFQRPASSSLFVPELGQAWYSVGYRGGDRNGADLGLFLKHAVEDNAAVLARRLAPLLLAHNIPERIKQVT